MSQNRSRIEPGDGDQRHGTINGYSNLKCRCTDCRRAWADYSADLRGSAYLPPEDSRHGRHSTYLNYACRCERCSAASREYYRHRREVGPRA